jgi:hypothetical protein
MELNLHAFREIRAFVFESVSIPGHWYLECGFRQGGARSRAFGRQWLRAPEGCAFSSMDGDEVLSLPGASMEGPTDGAESFEDLDGWKIDSLGRGQCPHFDT